MKSLGIPLAVLFVSMCCCCLSVPTAPQNVNTPASGNLSVAGPIEEIISYNTTSYNSPAPVGVAVNIGNLTIAVKDSLRPADAYIERENLFNSSAGQGKEYVLVGISVSCKAAGQSETCHVNPLGFNMVGSRGISYGQAFAVISDDLRAGEMYSGSTVSGRICFKVGQGETGLTLVYETLTLGEGPKAFLSIP